jgi:hypothetical protein
MLGFDSVCGVCIQGHYLDARDLIKQRRYVMARRWIVAVITAVSISLLTIGPVGAVVCNPLCVPDNRGTDHAKTVANQNGVNNGLATAQQQPGNYKTPTGPCSGC